MSAESRRSKLDDAARLRHMLDAARRALELAQGKKVSSLDPEAETALALTRLLEILGEAAKNVTPETQVRHPEVPWRDIADTRNRIIHGAGGEIMPGSTLACLPHPQPRQCTADAG